jgi:hypothetical protein
MNQEPLLKHLQYPVERSQHLEISRSELAKLKNRFPVSKNKGPTQSRVDLICIMLRIQNRLLITIASQLLLLESVKHLAEEEEVCPHLPTAREI